MEKRGWIAMTLVLFCILLFAGCKSAEVRYTQVQNNQPFMYFDFDLPDDCNKIIEQLNLVALGTFTVDEDMGEGEIVKKYLVIVFGCIEASEKATAWIMYSLETEKFVDFVFSHDGEKWYDREKNIVDIDNKKVKKIKV